MVVFAKQKGPYCDSDLLIESESECCLWTKVEEEEIDDEVEPPKNKLKMEERAKHSRKKLSEDMEKAIISRIELGHSMKDIAKDLEICEGTIFNVKKRNGLVGTKILLRENND